jgi:hypothetical protein
MEIPLILCYRKNVIKKPLFAFFKKPLVHGLPEKISTDKSGANKSGVDKINLLLTLLCLLTGIFYQTIKVLKKLRRLW